MKKNKLPAFLVFYGAEDFFLDRDYETMRKVPDRITVNLNGEDVKEKELLDILESRSFDGSERLVILDHAQAVKVGKQFASYVENKSPNDTYTVLVAIVRAAKLPEAWANAGAKGKIVERKQLKSWDTNNEIVKWTETEASRLRIHLDKGVADIIYKFIGNDLHRIVNELRKLAFLVGEGGTVTSKHVSLVLSPTFPAEPYEVADAAIAKNPKKAMNLLSSVYRRMGDNALVPVMSSLAKQVEKLLVARSMVDRKVPDEDIASRIGMNLWRFRVHYMPTVKKHSVQSLSRCMELLCQLDADVKGPSKSKRTLVELAVLSIAS